MMHAQPFLVHVQGILLAHFRGIQALIVSVLPVD